MIQASARAACACCAPAGCPEVDQDIVITGGGCFLSCYPNATPGASWGTFSFDFSGGYTLAYSPSGGVKYYVFTGVSGSLADYGDASCAGDPIESTPTWGIILICNDTPNEDGKTLGLYVSVLSLLGNQYLVINLQDNPANWFAFNEEVIVSTPCGSFTILVPAP